MEGGIFSFKTTKAPLPMHRGEEESPRGTTLFQPPDGSPHQPQSRPWPLTGSIVPPYDFRRAAPEWVMHINRGTGLAANAGSLRRAGICLVSFTAFWVNQSRMLNCCECYYRGKKKDCQPAGKNFFIFPFRKRRIRTHCSWHVAPRTTALQKSRSFFW